MRWQSTDVHASGTLARTSGFGAPSRTPTQNPQLRGTNFIPFRGEVGALPTPPLELGPERVKTKGRGGWGMRVTTGTARRSPLSQNGPGCHNALLSSNPIPPPLTLYRAIVPPHLASAPAWCGPDNCLRLWSLPPSPPSCTRIGPGLRAILRVVVIIFTFLQMNLLPFEEFPSQ